MKKIFSTHSWAKPACLALFGIVLLFMLSGCSAASYNKPIDANTPGVWNHFFVYPFSYLIIFFANLFKGDYGLSIILMTVIIRTAIMPLMLNQMKKQLAMREKMAVIQPELQALKDKYKNDTSAEARKQMQLETMQLYQKHQFNPLNMGCLPLILQFPITLGFYYAIRRTPEIAAHDFLWFSLGKPDTILPLIAAAVYYIQFRVSQSISMSAQQNQNKQYAVIGLLSPLMMGMFSFAMPAALPLYWAVGGIYIIVQTLVFKKLFISPKESASPAEK
ncbi:MAG TPA: membrane protein insertase YidC [Bacilli bacterium]